MGLAKGHFAGTEAASYVLTTRGEERKGEAGTPATKAAEPIG